MKKIFIVLVLVTTIISVLWAQDAPTSFPRKFLIEHFTGASCGYCPYGMAGIVEYLEKSTIPHIWVSHHSYEDELTIPENAKISVLSGVKANEAPYVSLNRTKITGSLIAFEPRYLVKSTITDIIASKCDTVTEASVTINHTFNAKTRELNVTVSGQVADTTVTEYLLTILIKENGLVGAQADYEYALNKAWKEFMHPRVVRDVITGPTGDTVIVNDQTYSKTLTYTVNDKWIPKNCCIVAYITPLSKKPIINAEQVPLVSGTIGGEQYYPYGITEAGNPKKTFAFHNMQVTPTENDQLEIKLISNDSIRTNSGWTNPVCIVYLNTTNKDLHPGEYPIQQDNQSGTITAGYRIDAECVLGGSLLVYAKSSDLKNDQISAVHKWRMTSGSMIVDVEGDISFVFKTYSGGTVTATYLSDVAVKNVRLGESNTQKIMRDGRLIIISEDKKYDALGNTMK